jgi:hypothetical protein
MGKNSKTLKSNSGQEPCDPTVRKKLKLDTPTTAEKFAVKESSNMPYSLYPNRSNEDDDLEDLLETAKEESSMHTDSSFSNHARFDQPSANTMVPIDRKPMPLVRNASENSSKPLNMIAYNTICALQLTHGPPVPLNVSGFNKSPSYKNSINPPIYDSNPFKAEVTPSGQAAFVSRLFLDTRNYENFRYLDTHSITFKSEKDVFLTGFSQYLVVMQRVQTNFEFTLLEGDSLDSDDYYAKRLRVLSQGVFAMSRTSIPAKQKMITINLDNQVKVEKNQFYTLKIMNVTKHPEFQTYKGFNGFEINYPFSFFPTKSSDFMSIKTCVKSGQIPELIYKNS